MGPFSGLDTSTIIGMAHSIKHVTYRNEARRGQYVDLTHQILYQENHVILSYAMFDL